MAVDDGAGRIAAKPVPVDPFLSGRRFGVDAFFSGNMQHDDHLFMRFGRWELPRKGYFRLLELIEKYCRLQVKKRFMDYYFQNGTLKDGEA
jgi:hypothetical protein